MIVEFFYINSLIILLLLVANINNICILSFAIKNLKNDEHKTRFIFFFFIVVLSFIFVLTSNHIFFFLASLLISNIFVVLLMIYNNLSFKNGWKQGKISAYLTFKYLFLSFLLVSFSLAIFCNICGSFLLTDIISFSYKINLNFIIAISSITLSAIIYGAALPFHKWFISSFNCHIATSAIMHITITNIGVFFIIKFLPIYIKTPYLLDIVLYVSFITVLLSSICKIMQSDIKRMLSFSTIEQISFIFMQISLGLVSSALAQLCLHSFFKTYLLLNSGNAYKNKKLNLDYEKNFYNLILSSICSFFALIVFSFITNRNIFTFDANLLLFLMIFATFMQISLILISSSFFFLPLSIIVSSSLTGLYASFIDIVDNLLVDSFIFMETSLLSIFKFIPILLLFTIWIFIFFLKNFSNLWENFSFMQKFYVYMLNLSQPYKETITTNRNNFK